MGVTIANAYVQIDPSFKGIEAKLHAGLDAPLEKAGRQAGEKAGKQVGAGIERAARQSGENAGASMATGIESKLKGVGSGISKVLSTALIATGLKKSIDAASDLNETLSKSQAIFGDAASGFEDIANGAAKSMGLSKRAYLDAAAGLKGLLDNLGLASAESIRWSKSMTQLGSDLGSFFNADPADAIEAIGSALRGESEPIRRYNVNINEAAVKAKALALGLYDGKGAIEQSAKATATLALITEQTARAQGDFARTADGVANSQRTAAAEAENAAASFGQALLPVYQRVVQVVGAAVGAFAKLPSGIQTTIVAVGGLVALSGPLRSFGKSLSGLAGAGTGGGLSMLGKIGIGIGLATVAIGAGIAIWQKFGERQREIAARSKEVAGALPAQVAETWRLADASGTASGRVNGLALAQQALSKALSATGTDGAKITQALGALGLQAEDTLTVLNAFAADPVLGVTELADKLGITKTNAYLLAEALDRTDGGLQAVREEFIYAATDAAAGALPDEMLMSADAAEALWKQLEPLAQALGEMEGQAKKVDLDKIAREFLNSAVASSDAAEALIKQAEQIEGLSRSGDGAFVVFQRYNKLLGDLPPAQRTAILGTEKLTAATGAYRTVAAGTLRIIDKTASAFDRAATRASGFQSALEGLAGGADLQRARDDWEGALSSIEAKMQELRDSRKGGRLVAADLLGSTDAARDMRAELDAAREKAIGLAAAMIQTGASNEEARSAMLLSRAALVSEAEHFGLTREQAEDYVNSLGLTPEAIETAIRLAGDEAAKAEIADVIAKLGEIPESVASSIQADIDNGSYATALAKLNALARTRTVLFNVQTVDSAIRGSNGGPARRVAGGPVTAGVPYIVGEVRPELFIPNVSGRIVPRVPPAAAGVRAGQVTVHINAPVYGVNDLQSAISTGVRDGFRRLTAQRRFAS